MPVERQKIFPSIAHFPEEPALPLPTVSNSVFSRRDTPLLMDNPTVVSLLRGYIENSEDERVRTGILHFKYDPNQRVRFNLLDELVQNKLEIEEERLEHRDTQKISRLSALNRELHRPPEFFNAKLRFMEHTISHTNQPEDVYTTINNDLRSIFKREEANIFFMENSVSTKADNELFQAQFKKYKSAKRAIAALSLFDGKKQPNEQDVLEYIHTADKRFPVKFFIPRNARLFDPSTHYIWIAATIIDNYIAEGFDVQMRLEQGTSKPGVADKLQKKEKVQGDSKTIISQMLVDVRRRNEKISEAIMNEIEQTEIHRKRTNLYGLFGGLHFSIMNTFPIHTTPSIIPMMADEEKARIQEMAGKIGINPFI